MTPSWRWGFEGKEEGDDRSGGKSYIRSRFYEYLKNISADTIRRHDGPDRQIKVIKSPEELDWNQEDGHLQDVTCRGQELPQTGAQDFEVHADVLPSVMVQEASDS